jgi:hypothetical protein
VGGVVMLVALLAQFLMLVLTVNTEEITIVIYVLAVGMYLIGFRE